MRTVTHMWLERKMEKLTKFDVVGYLDIDDLQTLYLDETAKENHGRAYFQIKIQHRRN